MIAMTTSNSISVKPDRFRIRRVERDTTCPEADALYDSIYPKGR